MTDIASAETSITPLNTQHELRVQLRVPGGAEAAEVGDIVWLELFIDVNQTLSAIEFQVAYDELKLAPAIIEPHLSIPSAFAVGGVEMGSAGFMELGQANAGNTPLIFHFFNSTFSFETGMIARIPFEVLALPIDVNDFTLGLELWGLYDGTTYQVADADWVLTTGSAPLLVDRRISGNFANHNFGTVTANAAGVYTVPPAHTVTVNNTYDASTGALTITLEGDNPAAFTLNPDSLASIDIAGSDTFTVVPVVGLAPGTYTAVVRITGVDIDVYFTVTFTVTRTTVTRPPGQAPQPPAEYEKHLAYMFGYGGNFRPRANITRAEAATILARTQLLDFEDGIDELPSGMTSFNAFSDVRPGDWFFYYVAWAYGAELIQGYGGRFRPNDPITREELAAILARTTRLRTGTTSFSDVADISNWAMRYVYTVYRAGWMEGDQGTFRPTDNILRAEVATAMNRVLGRLDSRPALYAADIEHLYRARDFYDVADGAWYFPSVLAAANDHRLTRDGDDVIDWKYIVR